MNEPPSQLSEQEIQILRDALRAAENLACIAYNGKQQDRIPDDYRRVMSEDGDRFDKARRQFTENMRNILVK